MSDQIKHECGIALVHLKKPLEFYTQKYGSHMYGVDKMFLMMEKQKNRGQDGAGFASLKLDLKPGDKSVYYTHMTLQKKRCGLITGGAG